MDTALAVARRRVSDPGFFVVAGRQRACRSFRPDPVPEADLERMLTAATWAPSAENAQPWEFVVVTDPARRAAIGDLGERAWRDGGRAHAAERLPEAMLADVEQGATGGIGSAPVVVVVAVDTTVAAPGGIGSSVFPAVQNLLLAATALGYGSALTTLATALAAELEALLGLPATVRPVAVVPIGRPARSLGPPRRRPAADRTHLNRYLPR